MEEELKSLVGQPVAIQFSHGYILGPLEYDEQLGLFRVITRVDGIYAGKGQPDAMISFTAAGVEHDLPHTPHPWYRLKRRVEMSGPRSCE